jgi:hypothetical protein
MIVLSRLGLYSVLGLLVLLSGFLVGNGQIQTFASSEAGNTTGIAGTTEITIADMNGTELFTSDLEGQLTCWIIVEEDWSETCDIEWGPGPGALLDVIMMNVTMTDMNGTEFIRFENITVDCSLSDGTQLTHCVQR